LLGYFNYHEIETSENNIKAFKLFINASEENHLLAQYFVGVSCFYGYGIMKSEKLALKYFKKTANENFTNGQKDTGYCYKNGKEIKKSYLLV
jgi:TPR repeat protein